MNPLSNIPPPNLRDVLNAFKVELMTQLHCCKPGRIQSFNATKQTAEVAIQFQALVYNQAQATGGQLQTTPTVVNYPLLVDVPVFTLFGGLGVVTCPIAAGDTCLVFFGDRDIDNWFTTGATAAPATARMHDLSDGFAIVGFRPATNPVASFDTDGVAVRHGTSKLKVKTGGGQATLDADLDVVSSHGGELKVDGDVTATSTNGGVIAAKTKLDLHNSSGSLKSALDALVTALTSWVNTDTTTPNPATVTALNAAKTQIDAILQ